MKDYELLDMIGYVNEDHVLAADSNVVRPGFRWKGWATAAACVALIAAVYPVFRTGGGKSAASGNGTDSVMAQYDAAPEETEAAPVPAPEEIGVARHSFTVAGEDGAAAVQDKKQSPETGTAPAMAAAGGVETYDAGTDDAGTGGGDTGSDIGVMLCEPWAEIPEQKAAEWYDALLRGCRLEENPEWYGGAWIAEDNLLAVAIVDGFRTPELEEELEEAAGDGAVLQFSTVKYSLEFLYGLLEPASRALDGMDLYAGVGVDVVNNCLSLDIYGGAVVPDEVLIHLAHLDPDDDAIRVRLFTDGVSAADGELEKGSVPIVPPELNSTAPPVPNGAWVGDEADAAGEKPNVPAEISLPPNAGEQSRSPVRRRPDDAPLR